MMRRTFGLIALATAAAPILLAKAGDKPFSVVLVHGAFVDASGWRAVYDMTFRKAVAAL
jgi:hypothetical protein